MTTSGYVTPNSTNDPSTQEYLLHSDPTLTLGWAMTEEQRPFTISEIELT